MKKLSLIVAMYCFVATAQENPMYGTPVMLNGQITMPSSGPIQVLTPQPSVTPPVLFNPTGTIPVVFPNQTVIQPFGNGSFGVYQGTPLYPSQVITTLPNGSIIITNNTWIR